MKQQEIILARIKTENANISICGDDALSQQIKEKMLKQSWNDSYSRYNGNSDFSYLPLVDEAVEICRDELEIVNGNKNISRMIPPRTRFRFLKRVINRFMFLTNCYQEFVNNSVYNSLSQILDIVRRLKRAVSDSVRKLDAAQQRIDALEKQLEQMALRELELEKQIAQLRSGEKKEQ